MKIIITISITILFFSTLSLAQSGQSSRKEPIQLLSKSSSSAYYSPGYGYTGENSPSFTFRVGFSGKEQKVSYFGENLKQLVKDNEQALAEMNTFAKKRRGMVFGYAMVGSGVIATIVGLEKKGVQNVDARTGAVENKYKLNGIGTLGAGTTFVGIIVIAFNGSGITNHIERAVQTYNGGLGVASSNKDGVNMNIKFTPSIEPNYIGIGLKVSLL
tara:strand:+ start:18288 stop:18932 length:645 start_codon:yes stop_codon:yes gene_type:complete